MNTDEFFEGMIVGFLLCAVPVLLILLGLMIYFK